jgi:hypothetical protein
VSRMRLPMTYSATSGFFLLAANFSGFFITFRFFDIAGLRSVLASHSVRPGRASLLADVDDLSASRGFSGWPTDCSASSACRRCWRAAHVPHSQGTHMQPSHT